MNDTVKLAAGILVHVGQSLGAAHSHLEHKEWIQCVVDVGEILDRAAEVDEDSEEGQELLAEMLALAEAIDPKLSIERITSGAENDSDDDAGAEPPDDETQT